MASRSRKPRISPREYTADSVPAIAFGQHRSHGEVHRWFGPPIEGQIDLQDVPAVLDDAQAGELGEGPQDFYGVAGIGEGLYDQFDHGGELVGRGQRWAEQV